MKKCIRGLDVKILKSPSGYYIGTFDPIEGPNCRLSGYYKDRGRAQRDLDKRCWIQDRSNAMENQFCHKGQGCQIHDHSKCFECYGELNGSEHHIGQRPICEDCYKEIGEEVNND